MNNKVIKYCIGIENKNSTGTQLRSKFFDYEDSARKWFRQNIVMFGRDTQAFIYCVVYDTSNDTYSVYSSEDIY